jgi:hypothetical protein
MMQRTMLRSTAKELQKPAFACPTLMSEKDIVKLDFVESA